MTLKIKYQSRNVTDSYIVKRWYIETPLGERFQILNQVEGCYELTERVDHGIGGCEIIDCGKYKKFEDCLEWIAEYTKHWDYKEG